MPAQEALDRGRAMSVSERLAKLRKEDVVSKPASLPVVTAPRANVPPAVAAAKASVAILATAANPVNPAAVASTVQRAQRSSFSYGAPASTAAPVSAAPPVAAVVAPPVPAAAATVPVSVATGVAARRGVFGTSAAPTTPPVVVPVPKPAATAVCHTLDRVPCTGLIPWNTVLLLLSSSIASCVTTR